MMKELWNRRRFAAVLPSALAALFVWPKPAVSSLVRAVKPHPEPRPGIDASKVLKAADLKHTSAAPVFDLVREIPQVVDGIRCYCGCADNVGSYSLLSCFEAPGMAQHCAVCQGQARLVHRLHKDGWSLNGIRASVDAQFADS